MADIAEIQVLKERTGPVVRLGVPKDTSFEVTASLLPKVNEIARELSGCPACTSGVPIEIFELPEISSIVQIDLQTLRTD
jgi:hypothetical protein